MNLSLPLGLKLCNSTSKTKKYHTQIQFENLENQTYDLVSTFLQEFQHFNSTAIDCIHGHINTEFYHNDLLTEDQMDQLMLQGRNKYLILSKSDKGSSVAFLDRQYYLEENAVNHRG